MKALLKVFSASASLRLCGLLLKRTHPLTQVVLTCLIAAFCLPLTAQTRDLTRWVNPFIGTGGHGHTFPGATRPFGMVQLSPDTRIDNWDGSSGYHYSDSIIYGFSHTHLSGTGIPDGADILFMPTISKNENFASPFLDSNLSTYQGYASEFSHDDEKAELGYYSVKINEKRLLAELTSTNRVGLHRYTFSKSKDAGIFLDLNWRDKSLDADIKVMGKNRVEGFRRSSSWAKDQRIYFVAEFSKNFTSANVWRTDGSKWSRFFSFNTKDREQILLKVAISYVSIEGARKNLEAELPHWDFDKVRADAKAAWNKELGKIEVSGGTDEQTTNFYTALYHTMIHPNVFNDVDGKYRGHDGKIHQLPGYAAQPLDVRRSSASPEASFVSTRGSAADLTNGRRSRESLNRQQRKSKAFPQIDGQSPPEHYTVFSLWDTFRAAHPLYTIIDERRTVDFINTFIRQYEQGGRLPVWELWGEETDTMIGYHAVSVIADAMAKGIKGFDYEKAYAAAKHSAELDHFGLAGYKKRGYVSSEDENESVSKTLEYAYNDWCIAQIARVMMLKRFRELTTTGLPTDSDEDYGEKTRTYLKFNQRAKYFENLFDPETGFFRPKKNGGFIEPFAPNEVTFHFTEGNSWQYSFFVPHDVARLIALHGGREQFAAKLDELFTTDQKLTGRFQPDITGLIGQYAHGNEPSHHIPYLYNYAGQPWKTQQLVRRIMDEFYKNAPDGLIGNEDAGQMSAWFVLSAMGFYPVAPGGGIYQIGTPLFKKTVIRLENGKQVVINADNVSEKNFYVRSIKWNGKSFDGHHFSHNMIKNGAVIDFSMTDKPGLKEGGSIGTSSEVLFPAVPTINGERSFRGTNEIMMAALSPDFKIFYTTDGSEPGQGSAEYTRPFNIDKSTTIKAVAVDAKGNRSHIVDAFFLKRENDWTVNVISEYSTQYTGGGDDAIVDGIRGTINFSSGEWQGVQGKPYEAVIDLGRETTVSEVGGGFLQSVGSWIWMPQRVEFSSSDDGENFKVIADIKTEFPLQTPDKAVQDFTQKITPIKTRYIRIKAFNFGKIPQWHLGTGGDPWIFIDEVIIK